jgi:hypothetical protein
VYCCGFAEPSPKTPKARLIFGLSLGNLEEYRLYSILCTCLDNVTHMSGNDRLENLTTDDFLVIDALFHERTFPENLHGRVKKLIDLGIIEHIGRNKYILARGLYEVTGIY